MQFSQMHIFSSIFFVMFLLNNGGFGKLLSKTSERVLRAQPDISFPPMKIPTPHPHCVQLQCRYFCFNGKSINIENDVEAVEGQECQSIDELHLYNYNFPQKTIPKHVLGNISDYVTHLSIYASDVVHIENGAFQSKSLTGVHLENLKLDYIDKSIFEQISEKFTCFTLIQRETALEHVDERFLEHVKYQIKKLTIQTGLLTVKNLTNSDCLLNSLEEVNLSYNNFGSSLKQSSFAQLSMVEKLNLTHSEIFFLPELIFSDIVGTLKSLELSNNKLTVISQNVFGWRELTKGLAIYLTGNPWNCTCELRTEMVNILVYQTEKVYCGTPEGVLATSEILCRSSELNNDTTCLKNCNGSSGGGSALIPTFPPLAMPTTTLYTDSTEVTTDSGFDITLTTDTNGVAKLECHKDRGSQETEMFAVQWPNFQFDINEREGFKVDIEVSTTLNGTYGILWFNKVTTQYYKMEVNYKEYGLGCYGVLEYVTTIEHLLPDMSYTFCLVLKNQLTVSPFSCKSAYIDGNLNIKYSAWLTTNMKTTGISLVIVGIVLFKFLGILLVFLLIKQKPTLVKGSKRVVMQKNDSTKIIVFPEDKTLQKFKLMEEQIAKRNSKGANFRRLSSVSATSVDSNQSYINPVNQNLYEKIPAYQHYLPTYGSETGADVSYTEIPLTRKRTSNDPLPAVPNASKPSTPALTAKNLTMNFLDTGSSNI